jgi:hypothetical protein
MKELIDKLTKKIIFPTKLSFKTQWVAFMHPRNRNHFVMIY